METPPNKTLDVTDSEQECGDSAVARVRSTLKSMREGEVLEVKVDNREHEFVISAWSNKANHKVLNIRHQGRHAMIHLEKLGNVVSDTTSRLGVS